MIYSHLTIWINKDEVWHSLSRPGTRDLSMGVLKPWEVDRIIAWARQHNMTFADQRFNPSH